MELTAEQKKIIDFIYETKALVIAPADKPFWYTSGMLGPYYINAQFLIGSSTLSEEILNMISEYKEKKDEGSQVISQKMNDVYNTNNIYKETVNTLVNTVKSLINLDEIDAISGGERRDWFFSFELARHLNKPHLTIYKDLSMKHFHNGETTEVESLQGMNILHVADLLTIASSYDRTWVPAIKAQGGTITHAVNVFDRNQGGVEVIEKHNITPLNLITLNQAFLDYSLEKGYLSADQKTLIENYLKDPIEGMKGFLDAHPNFIQDVINGDDPKAKQRAELCMEEDFYNLK